MIIVASRPVGSVNLRCDGDIIVSKRIEVLGFSRKSIFSYIDSYYSPDVQTAKKLKNYLLSHVNLLHMCYLPVHAAMICFIYQQPIERIPVTETKMYECFTLLTIKRKLKRDKITKVYGSLSNLDGVILDSFVKVLKLAFEMTVESKQTIITEYSESDLPENCDVHYLGLVTTDETAELIGMQNFCSFLHLTFQEFLAACHIQMCPTEKQLEIIRKNVNNEEMLMVWKFFCGSNTFNSCSTNALEIMKLKHLNDLYRIQCAFESQQSIVCDSIFVGRDIRSLKFNNQVFLPTDWNALAYLCNETSTTGIALIFNGCTFDENGAQILMDKIKSAEVYKVTSLSFSVKSHKEGQIEAIMLLLKRFHFLNELCLKNVELGPEQIELLTDDIKLPDLKYLGIRIPIKEAECSRQCRCKDLLDKLSFGSSNLEEVRYIYNEFSSESHKKCFIHLLNSFNCKITTFCDLIPESILSNIDIDLSLVPDFLKISNLILVNCNLVDSDLKYLMNADLIRNLESLQLDFNQITCSGAIAVSQIIQKCTKLTHLSLSCNMIGNDGAMAISGSLLPSKLQELDLEGNCFGDEAALALAKISCEMCDNFKLKLNNCHILRGTMNKLQELSHKVKIDNKNSVLKFVSLSHPDSIKRAIHRHGNMLTLNLSDRRFYDSATEALAQGIQHCNFLRTLNLSNCDLKKINDLFRNIIDSAALI